MKMGAEKSERLYEEITDYEKLKSIFGDVIINEFSFQRLIFIIQFKL